MNSKELWREILNPLRWKGARLVFHYSRDEDEKTYHYRVEYDFLSKNWKVTAHFFPNKQDVWNPMRTNKEMRKILITKAIETLKREIRRMEK